MCVPIYIYPIVFYARTAALQVQVRKSKRIINSTAPYLCVMYKNVEWNRNGYGVVTWQGRFMRKIKYCSIMLLYTQVKAKKTSGQKRLFVHEQRDDILSFKVQRCASL